MRWTGFRLTRRRFLMFLALLLVTVLASFWVIPWLLMPQDLWRMQGEWKRVRVETKDNENINEDAEDIVTITGSRLKVSSEPDYCLLRLEPEERTFQLLLMAPNERRFLGFTVPMPLWLRTPRSAVIGDYELADESLVLHLRALRDPATGEITDMLEDAKVHLGRTMRK